MCNSRKHSVSYSGFSFKYVCTEKRPFKPPDSTLYTNSEVHLIHKSIVPWNKCWSTYGVSLYMYLVSKKVSVNRTEHCFVLQTEKNVILISRPPKKMMTLPAKTSAKGLLSGDDPYLIDCSVTQKLFPQLSLESSTRQGHGGTSSLQLITLREGDKSVTLPSLSIEQNYSQMLSELVMNIWSEYVNVEPFCGRLNVIRFLEFSTEYDVISVILRQVT